MKTIGLIGDSIAQGFWDEEALGWFYRFANKLLLKYPYKFGFINRSKDGARIFDAYKHICSDDMTKWVDICIISIGINDTIRWNSPENQMDISKDLREETWNYLLERTNKYEKTIVIGIMPVVDERYHKFAEKVEVGEKPLFHLQKDVDEYNKDIEKWCKDKNVDFISLDPCFEGEDLNEYLYDEGHPNAKGHKKIAEFLMPKIEKIIIN